MILATWTQVMPVKLNSNCDHTVFSSFQCCQQLENITEENESSADSEVSLKLTDKQSSILGKGKKVDSCFNENGVQQSIIIEKKIMSNCIDEKLVEKIEPYTEVVIGNYKDRSEFVDNSISNRNSVATSDTFVTILDQKNGCSTNDVDLPTENISIVETVYKDSRKTVDSKQISLPTKTDDYFTNEKVFDAKNKVEDDENKVKVLVTEIASRQLLSGNSEGNSSGKESDIKSNMSPSLANDIPKIKPYTVVDLSTMSELSSLEVDKCLRDAKMLDENHNDCKTLDNSDLPPNDLILPPKKNLPRLRLDSLTSILSMPSQPNNPIDGESRQFEEEFRSRAFTAPANYHILPNNCKMKRHSVSSRVNDNNTCATSPRRNSLQEKKIAKPIREPPSPPLLPWQTCEKKSREAISSSSSCQSMTSNEAENNSLETKIKPNSTNSENDDRFETGNPVTKPTDDINEPNISKRRSYSMSAVQDRPLPLAYNSSMRLSHVSDTENKSASVVLPWLSLTSCTEGNYTPQLKPLPDDDLPTTHFYDDIDDVRKKAKQHRLIGRTKSVGLPPVHDKYTSVQDPNDEEEINEQDSHHSDTPSSPLSEIPPTVQTEDESPQSNYVRPISIDLENCASNGHADKVTHQRSKISRLFKKLSSKKKDDNERTSKKSKTPEPLRRKTSQMLNSNSPQAELLTTPLQNRRKFPNLYFSLRGKHEAKKHERNRSYTMDAIASSIISNKRSSASTSMLNDDVNIKNDFDADNGPPLPDRRSSMSTININYDRVKTSTLPKRLALSTVDVSTFSNDEPSYANFPFSQVAIEPPLKPHRAHHGDTRCQLNKGHNSTINAGAEPVDWSSQLQLSMARLSQKIPDDTTRVSEEITTKAADGVFNNSDKGSDTKQANNLSPAISSPMTSPRSSSTGSWHSTSWPIVGFDNNSSSAVDVFNNLVETHKDTIQKIAGSACISCECGIVEAIPYSQFQPTGQQIPLDYDEYVVFPVMNYSGDGDGKRSYTAWQQECGTNELRSLSDTISEKLILQSTHPNVMHVCCLKRNPARSNAANPTVGYLYLSSQLPKENLHQFIVEAEDLHGQDAEPYEREVCRILLQVCCGVEYLREQGIRSYPLCSYSILVLAVQKSSSKESNSIQIALNSLPLLEKSQSMCNLDDNSIVLHRLACLLYELMHLSSYTVSENNRYSDVPTIPMRSLYSHGLKNIAMIMAKGNATLGHVSGLLQTLLFGPGDLRHLPLDTAQITTERWVNKRCVEIVTNILKDILSAPINSNDVKPASSIMNFHKIHLECQFLTRLQPVEILKACLIVWN